MKTALYYASFNPKGSSAVIVDRLKEKLLFPVDGKNVVDLPKAEDMANYDFYIFLVATYGDQELQDDIEKYLISIHQDLTGKKFAICELGNYYGYDDYSFGSGKIIESHLVSKNAAARVPIASIDTLPKIDWQAIDRWVIALNQSLG